MGDRANVFIQQERDPDGSDEWQGIGIYSHWDGVNLHRVVRDVLPLAKGRIGDPSYFARIVVQHTLARLAEAESETGFGLWVTHPDDNEHPIMVVNAMTGQWWYSDDYRGDQ